MRKLKIGDLVLLNKGEGLQEGDADWTMPLYNAKHLFRVVSVDGLVDLEIPPGWDEYRTGDTEHGGRWYVGRGDVMLKRGRRSRKGEWRLDLSVI